MANSVTPEMISFVKGVEGYNPQAYFDGPQYTNGWGTRASSPTEVISKDVAEARLASELQKAADYINSLDVRGALAPNQFAALTSAAFNLGSFKSGLEEAIRSGTPQEISSRLATYIGTQVPGTEQGVANRRGQEVGLFNGVMPASYTAANSSADGLTAPSSMFASGSPAALMSGITPEMMTSTNPDARFAGVGPGWQGAIPPDLWGVPGMFNPATAPLTAPAPEETALTSYVAPAATATPALQAANALATGAPVAPAGGINPFAAMLDEAGKSLGGMFSKGAADLAAIPQAAWVPVVMDAGTKIAADRAAQEGRSAGWTDFQKAANDTKDMLTSIAEGKLGPSTDALGSIASTAGSTLGDVGKAAGGVAGMIGGMFGLGPSSFDETVDAPAKSYAAEDLDLGSPVSSYAPQDKTDYSTASKGDKDTQGSGLNAFASMPEYDLFEDRPAPSIVGPGIQTIAGGNPFAISPDFNTSNLSKGPASSAATSSAASPAGRASGGAMSYAASPGITSGGGGYSGGGVNAFSAGLPGWVDKMFDPMTDVSFHPASFWDPSSPNGINPSGGSAFDYAIGIGPNGLGMTGYDVPGGGAFSFPTETVNADSGNISYSDMGGGGGSSGKVLCSYYMRRGWLPKEIWKADTRFSMRLPQDMREGYLWWARPTVRFLDSGTPLANVAAHMLWPVIRSWAFEMAYREGAISRGTLLGKALIAICGPISTMIGRRLRNNARRFEGLSR